MLSFRLFGIPVKVRGTFLLVAVLLGLLGRLPVDFIVAWVAVVFVSILIHELGHALTAIAFGARVEIELNGFGGLTRWSAEAGDLGPGRRAVVAGAGSAFGVAFGAAVWLFDGVSGPHVGMTSFVLDILVRVNVFWGLLNWLPLRPLDGGHLVLSLLERVAPNRAVMVARIVFVTSAGVALVIAVLAGFPIIAVLAGWLLLSEFSAGSTATPRSIPPLTYEDTEEGGTGSTEPDEQGQ